VSDPCITARFSAINLPNNPSQRLQIHFTYFRDFSPLFPASYKHNFWTVFSFSLGHSNIKSRFNNERESGIREHALTR
jgi:hypothetical protein